MQEHERSFYLSYDIVITLKSHFCHKNDTCIILPLCTQRCYGRHNVSLNDINFIAWCYFNLRGDVI